jgi:hypothetical protein
VASGAVHGILLAQFARVRNPFSPCPLRLQSTGVKSNRDARCSSYTLACFLGES